MPPSPDPGAASALFDHATQLIASGRPGEAIDPLAACLRLAPDFGPGYVNLALSLGRFGLQDEALTMAQAAHALMPGSEAATLCLAALLFDRAEFAAAAALYEQLLGNSPCHAGLLSSLGNCLVAMGRAAEALPLHARAVAAAPDDAQAHYNRADALLAAGDFAAGWDEYEWRWRRPGAHKRDFGPPWAGEPLDGRTILLHAEQGFGDTLQFARYAPPVAQRGGRVVLEVQPALVRLMRSLEGVAAVVAQGETLPEFDAHCPLLSLPRAFGTRLGTIPAAIPYLAADPALAGVWRQRLPHDGARLVGLVWAGSAHPDAGSMQVYDQRRSLPLAELGSLGDAPGVRFVSLQKGPAAAQLRDPPPGLAVLDLMGGVADFADTAAIVAGLDLVISVDTAVAHLAAAMGRPVWLLSRSDGCWRWLQGRHDSPWYPTLRLYRQRRAMDWQDVVARVRQDLTA